MNFCFNIRSSAFVFLHHLLDVLGTFKEKVLLRNLVNVEYFGICLLHYEKDSLVLLASQGRPRSQSWTDTSLHVDMFVGELILLPHFWPPCWEWTRTLKCLCLFTTSFQAAVQHCEKEAKPQGGDPTALSLWDQNSHCSMASPHVASRRVKTSCLLTTTPKQSPLWLDHICCTSTGSTHCLPARLYLNYFFFF